MLYLYKYLHKGADKAQVTMTVSFPSPVNGIVDEFNAQVLEKIPGPPGAWSCSLSESSCGLCSDSTTWRIPQRRVCVWPVQEEDVDAQDLLGDVDDSHIRFSGPFTNPLYLATEACECFSHS